VERRRRHAFANWAFRVALPEFVALAPSLAPLVETLRALPPVVDETSLAHARAAVYSARDKCWSARDVALAELRQRVREKAAVDAAAVAAAVAAADADADAAAVADAAAAVAAVAAADADAAAAAAAGLYPPDVWQRAIAASKKSHELGHTWSRQFNAAYAVFRAEPVDLRSERFSALGAVWDRLDDSFRALLIEVCAYRSESAARSGTSA
jgi:hypothetical protein